MGVLHQGERLATLSRNLDLLSRCPPLERQEWLRAVVTLDGLIGRIDATLQEARLLGVAADQAVQELVLLIHSAAEVLQSGFADLREGSASVKQTVLALNGLVEAIDRRYLHTLGTLFAPDRWSAEVTPATVLHGMKRWMLLRCLFEVKQHLALVGETMLALAAMREAHASVRPRAVATRPDALFEG